MLANATSPSPLVHEPRDVFDETSEGMKLSSFRVYLAGPLGGYCRIGSMTRSRRTLSAGVGLPSDYAALMKLHGDGDVVPRLDARILRQR
jgi:hypothetical protein